MKRWGFVLRLFLVPGLVPVAALAQVDQGARNAPWLTPAFAGQTRAPEAPSRISVRVEDFATGLEFPWGIAALPDGRFLVTERPGRLRLIARDGTIGPPIRGLPEVYAARQGGLLDVAIGPDFARDRVIFWTYAKPMGWGRSATAAARGVLSEDGSHLTEVQDIFVQEPPSRSARHYGARIVFDGKGHAFITTGERATAGERVLAQDLSTTYGKVLRIGLDGSIPADNPFAGGGGIATIWSSGHRNVQGAAIEPGSGRLWTVEHGPAGGDELNRPEPGANYGWPVISYGVDYNGSAIGEGIAAKDGMAQPVYFWDPAIAPSGMVFYSGRMFPEWRGNLLIASLKGEALVRLVLQGGRVAAEEHLLRDAGRLRDVEVAADGALLLLVDAADGRVLRLTRQ